MDIQNKTKMIEHPLEDIFDIEPGTTVVEYKEVVPEPVVDHPAYDSKDNEIEDQLQEIYSIAMSAAVSSNDEIERVEGKYKARISEVVATNLTVALGAIREKAALKMHKDKLTPKAGNVSVDGNYTVNNNLIVADRNEILRAFANKDKS